MKNSQMLKALLYLVIIASLLASCSPGVAKIISPTQFTSTLRSPTNTPIASNATPTRTSPTPVPSTPTTQAQPTSSPVPTTTTVPTPPTTTSKIKTVFLIVMENHNWSDILKSSSAPYINNTLLPQASYAQQYFNPPGNHPSEPNYLWLEAGTAFGITNDSGPQSNHQSSTDHLVTYLNKAGFTWKAYEEGITGSVCPLSGKGLYAPKHNPMVYFNDVTNTNDPNSAYCIAHERPYTELQSDLQNNTVAQYNFITPDQCDDMHNSNGCQTTNSIKNGDTWLSEQIPMIMSSQAYQQGGVIFITWDESVGGDKAIGMIVLSPFAKGGGYSNNIYYTHSSTLRTIQEIFNLSPFLGDAAKATDLSDLFRQFP
jgi:hypothetical protein